MNRIRRGLLLALTASVVAGAGFAAPAQASFADTASVSTGIETATVAAPTNVVGSLTCGRNSATMAVSWTQSTSARVSGYRVTVHYSDGYTQSEDVSAGTTSWSKSTDLYWVTNYSVRYSVTTLTDYGWSTQSSLTGAFQC